MWNFPLVAFYLPNCALWLTVSVSFGCKKWFYCHFVWYSYLVSEGSWSSRYRPQGQSMLFNAIAYWEDVSCYGFSWMLNGESRIKQGFHFVFRIARYNHALQSENFSLSLSTLMIYAKWTLSLVPSLSVFDNFPPSLASSHSGTRRFNYWYLTYLLDAASGCRA